MTDNKPNEQDMAEFNTYAKCYNKWSTHFTKFRQELLQLVIEDVPHRYQERLLEKLR